MNTRHLIYLHAALLALLTMFTSAAATAEITSLCDGSNRCTVSRAITPGVNTSVQLIWRGQAMVGKADTLSSRDGRIVLEGGLGRNAQLSVNTALTQTLNATADATPLAFSINETLLLPAEFSQQAAALGLRQINYVRSFTLDGATATASQIIRLNQANPGANSSISLTTQRGASAVSISRVSLRFDTGTLVETLAQHGALHAIATINFNGAGMLDGVWEVASLKTGTQTVFRPLKNVRQYIGAGRQVALQSPSLPTNELGVYAMRLRLVQPRIEQEQVVLRYQVSSGSLTHTTHVQVLAVSEPSPNALLNSSTEFSWATAPGTKAYQIELFDHALTGRQQNTIPQDIIPKAGLQLAATQTSSPLSISVLNNLEPGRTYYWRVVAIGADGVIMGASPLREIRMQE
ncbi:MAG: hypothetical protein ACI9Y1_002226 [Lentisphaeria bacterium]|jgi:hypothetical protein